MRNITETHNVTEEERDILLAKALSIDDWLKEKISEQKELAKNVDPVVTSEEVTIH